MKLTVRTKSLLLVPNVQKGAQLFDLPSLDWLGQRQHAGGATEANWWIVDDLPAGRADFDGAPFLVSEVEINYAVVRANPNIDKPLRAIEGGACLDNVERRLDRV